ncbi:hypothetical protein DRP53_10320 [candidate division WOR-3 bacterium]|uniref:Uncharacterized protein n=1 Tax=candidate division WOR-3 bacterium TaxID=2052148 RepID=A0A660SCX9_UNCW3|nr:MAG: hypothetical protein DRP53_10320 [candidate division WOR-3 bacterium]
MFHSLLIIILLILFIFTRSWVILSMIGLYLLINLLTILGFIYPRFGVFLFRHRGPRTDVKYMTKHDLYRSGVQFLILAILILPFLIISGLWAASPILMGFQFVFSILFLMFIVGGIYLLLRGLIRKQR